MPEAGIAALAALLTSLIWYAVLVRMDAAWQRERHDLRQSVTAQSAVITQLRGPRPSYPPALPSDPAVIRAMIDAEVGPATAWEDEASQGPETWGV